MASGENNSLANLNIDEIVREVFARLAATANAPSAGPKAVQANGAAGELVLSAKVVSLAELEGRLNGARRVVVARGAIITPAARDLLKRQSIDVAYAIAAAAGFRHRLLFGVAETRYEPAVLVRSLVQEGTAVERLANSGVAGVVGEMCDGVAKGGQLGLLMTDQSAAAICLANRRPGVRAALGVDKRQIAAAVAEVGINFLVIAPQRHGLFEIKQMMKEFLTGGPRVCPNGLRERLG
jgi:hypothetical protein